VAAAEFITLWGGNISTLGCWKYFNKFFNKVISVFNTSKACLNSKFFSTLRKFTKKLVLKRKCSHTKSHQHFIFL
jgi:hypothetical protein